jgi:hypothetical protein
VPLLKSLLAIGVMAAVIVGAAYWRETVRLTKASTFTPLKSAIQRRTLAGMLMYRVGDFLDLPAYSYLVGLESAARHDVIGHPSYLLGRLSDKGWWYYFPVAFAVKTPTAVLLLLVVCLFLALRRRFSPRKLSFDYVLLAAPAAIYFLASVRSHLNLGLRHILPIYPFLFILLTAVLFRRMRHYARGALAAVICLLIAVQVAESAHIYPHYLAFFNSLAGGPARGPEYLVDSNIDWGQDLKKVRAWWWAHGSPPLCLAYFGRADAEYYHVPLTWLPATWEREQRAKLDCIGAISVTVLHDVYVKPGEFQWLRELRPMGQVGYSIYLYDLRKR